MVFSLRTKLKHLDGVKFHDTSSDCIPYVAHYDEKTVLTKNYLLVQTFMIPDSCLGDFADVEDGVRDMLKKSILQHLPHNASICVHTVRTTTDIDKDLSQGDFLHFSQQLHEKYAKITNFECSYTNLVYVSIILHAPDAAKSWPSALSSVPFFVLKKRTLKGLDSAVEILSKITNNIMDDLHKFNPIQLQLYSKDGIMYSKNLSFFHFLLTSKKEEVKLPMEDLSEYIADFMSIAVGFNTISTKLKSDNTTNFSIIFALKCANYLSSMNLNKILCLPMEFIITQFIHFTSDQSYEKKIKERIEDDLESEAQELWEEIGLQEVIEYSDPRSKKYCQTFTSMKICENSLKKLNKTNENVLKTMSEIGIIPVRMDAFLESIFWSIFPGNSHFHLKTYTTFYSYCLQFASLQSEYMGKFKGAPWNFCITALKMLNNQSHFFFNFHYKDNGHTIVVGNAQHNVSFITNFLISEASRNVKNIFYIDNTGYSEIFINAMDEQYFNIFDSTDLNTQNLKLNPLLCEDTTKNREFLKKLFITMRGPLTKKEQRENFDLSTIVKDAINEIFKLPESQRTLSNAEKHILPISGNIKLWYGKGTFASIFDNENGTLWNENARCFDTRCIAKTLIPAPATFLYMLHNIEIALNKQENKEKTILVVNMAHIMVGSFVDQADLSDWFDRMKNLNVVIIFNIIESALHTSSNFISLLHENTGTKIYSPLYYLTKKDFKTFNFSQKELSQLDQLPGQGRHYIIKQGSSSVTVSIDLKKNKDVYILLSNVQNVALMKELQSTNGSKVEDWLQDFYDEL